MTTRTYTIWSPRRPERRCGIPRPWMRSSLPYWVPGGISIRSGPSTVGISIVSPSAACASPLGTGLRGGAGLGTGTLAGLARLGPRDGQLAFDTADGLFESEPQVQPKVRSAAGSGARSAGGGGSEEHVENVIDAAKAGAPDIGARRARVSRVRAGVIALAWGVGAAP